MALRMFEDIPHPAFDMVEKSNQRLHPLLRIWGTERPNIKTVEIGWNERTSCDDFVQFFLAHFICFVLSSGITKIVWKGGETLSGSVSA